VVIKREVFDSAGLFDESLPVCEDYDMWLRITARFPVLFIDKPYIIKNGGHQDQLSRRYEAMDRFRIKSIVNILNSNVLNEDMRLKALKELEKKCTIVAKGAYKRGKIKEAEFFMKIPEEVLYGEKFEI